jgi:hypothetical protein
MGQITGRFENDHESSHSVDAIAVIAYFSCQLSGYFGEPQDQRFHILPGEKFNHIKKGRLAATGSKAKAYGRLIIHISI